MNGVLGTALRPLVEESTVRTSSDRIKKYFGIEAVDSGIVREPTAGGVSS